MASITYNGESESIEWMGETFAKGKAVTTDNAALIRAAGNNRFFTVTNAGDTEADTPFNRGAAAATEDKKRSVPPAYRGKTEADEWLRGFDSIRPPDPGAV
jgi:hypothetical protein